MSPSKEALEKMLAIRYNGNVSQYGWAFEDGAVEQCSYDGCHSQILSYPRTPVAAFSFGPNIPQVRLQYIFDHSVSPWRSLLTGLGSTIKDTGEGSPFIFTDLTLDANLLVNMMFSLRWPAEQIWSYNLWESLLMEEVHPAVADLLVALVQTRDTTRYTYSKDNLRYTTKQLMHSNFIALDCTMQYAENFVHGRLVGGNGNPFCTTKTEGLANDYNHQNTAPRGYKPVVGAFGTYSGISTLDQLRGVRGEYMAFLEKQYGELRGLSHLAEIGLLEQKRFKLDDWDPGKRHASKGVFETPCGVELSAEAIQQYEDSRSAKSDWGYVQESSRDDSHAHQF